MRGRDSAEPAELRRILRGRSDALEQLAVETNARGCSTWDVEAIFRDEEGRSLVSRSAVSELTESLWEEYEAFATRDLSELRPLNLFVDGIAERLRAGAKREAVLCTWAITWEGAKVLVHLAPGTKESTECCRGFLQDLLRRGMTAPMVVVTVGAAGLIRAVEECFPQSLRQRCLAHKLRNLVGEVTAEFKQAAKAAYQAPSVAMARVLHEDLVTRYEKLYPTAVRCFEEDFEACIAHLHCPSAHRRVVRTTNPLERLFVEERRRVRAAGTVFGERPVLKLMFGAVLRTSENWRGIRVSEFEAAQPRRLQEQIEDEHWKDHQLNLEGSTPGKIYSTNRT